MTRIELLCLLLALVARGQDADVCEDPACLSSGDFSALSLLQRAVVLDVAPHAREPASDKQQRQHVPRVAPHVSNLAQVDDKKPCKDSTTYKDPYWGDGCAEWANWSCAGTGMDAELKANCPKACKVCGGGGGGGGGAGSQDSGGWTPQEWVDAHNMYRCMHGVPNLQWNPTIATKAQAWADKSGGEMEHSSSAFRSNVAGFKYLGENLAWASPNPPSAAKSTKMWYDEIKDTPGGTGAVSSFNYKTGHYTQVVWKASTDLGCGIKNGLTVCMYGPGGNFGDAYSENVPAKIKSEADCKK